MATPSGQIALSNVNTELGNSSTAQINMNNASLRSLAGVPSGQISMSDLQNKSLAGSVVFDGSGDYLSLASNSDFSFGTGDFTIEVWVYLNSNSIGVIYSNEVANSLFLYLDSGNLVVRNYATTNLFDLAGPSLNTWTHIALSRSGTDLRLFFNGVQQGSTVTNSTNWTQNGTEIGAFNNGTQSLNGYISNLRVVKGTALYTSGFSVPTSPLTNVTNTVLLCCQSRNSATDAAVKPAGVTISASGNVTASSNNPFYPF